MYRYDILRVLQGRVVVVMMVMVRFSMTQHDSIFSGSRILVCIGSTSTTGPHGTQYIAPKKNSAGYLQRSDNECDNIASNELDG